MNKRKDNGIGRKKMSIEESFNQIPNKLKNWKKMKIKWEILSKKVTFQS